MTEFSLPSMVAKLRVCGRALLVTGIAVLALALPACPRQGGGGTVIDTPELGTCEDNAECGQGQICAGGTCVAGSCDPTFVTQCGSDVQGEDRSPYCCRIFEKCDPIAFQCRIDPDAQGIGCPPNEADCVTCFVDEQCGESLGFGAFCSGGRCLLADGRKPCTQSFQCDLGDRCDRTVYLCVPDNGGCGFCGPDFPELCCENGQLCDTETGNCVEIGAPECTPDTVRTDCRPGDKCDELGRCVQCIQNRDCGPGTECNTASGLCISIANRCETDSTCAQGLRCINQQCTFPDCDVGRACSDSRQICENFVCVLPPAICNETDEPNNNFNQSVELASLASGYSGTLCRGDVDFISFPVLPNKRYTATVTVTTPPFSGLVINLYDTTQTLESSAVFATSPSSMVVRGVTGPQESGRFYLQVSSALVTTRDTWSYAVTFNEADASAEADCTAAGQAGQEPNDAFGTATLIQADGVARSFSRCGTSDVDFFRFTVPEQNGVEVVLDGFANEEGNLNIELFNAPNTGARVRTSSTTTNREQMDFPEGATELWVRVFLANPSGALQNQLYNLSARAIPRPAACDVDAGEIDDDLARAQLLSQTTAANGTVSGAVTAVRCNPQDRDHIRFTVPANIGGSFAITFTHSEGDLLLDLLNATTGAVLVTSNTSSVAAGFERVDLPQSTSSVDYVARVRTAATTGIIAQPYTATLSTFDASQCGFQEPNNTIAQAICVGGEFASTAPACAHGNLPSPLVSTLAGCVANAEAPGCGRTCGFTDNDLFRVGRLESGRNIVATLRFNPAEGDLGLILSSTLDNVTLQTLRSLNDQTDGTIDGVITLAHSTTGSTREHLLTVTPRGSAGHAGQVYSLSVEVSGACIPDAFEGSTGNGTVANATVIPRVSDTPDTRNATICINDIDVYEFAINFGETIRVSYDGPEGGRIRVGTRPSNMNGAPNFIAGVDATAGADGLAQVSVTSDRVQFLYLQVERANSSAGFGDYSFTISYRQ